VLYRPGATWRRPGVRLKLLGFVMMVSRLMMVVSRFMALAMMAGSKYAGGAAQEHSSNDDR